MTAPVPIFILSDAVFVYDVCVYVCMYICMCVGPFPQCRSVPSDPDNRPSRCCYPACTTKKKESPVRTLGTRHSDRCNASGLWVRESHHRCVLCFAGEADAATEDVPGKGDGEYGGDGEFRFLFIGRLSSEKSPGLFIRAFALLQQGLYAGFNNHTFATVKVVAVIIGDGPLLPGLQYLCLQLGIAEQVSFLGALSPTAVQRELLRGHLLVNPRVDGETFGFVFAEAQIASVPVVAFARSVMPRGSTVIHSSIYVMSEQGSGAGGRAQRSAGANCLCAGVVRGDAARDDRKVSRCALLLFEASVQCCRGADKTQSKGSLRRSAAEYRHLED